MINSYIPDLDPETPHGGLGDHPHSHGGLGNAPPHDRLLHHPEWDCVEHGHTPGDQSSPLLHQVGPRTKLIGSY